MIQQFALIFSEIKFCVYAALNETTIIALVIVNVLA